jgi:hypothetical protein
MKQRIFLQKKLFAVVAPLVAIVLIASLVIASVVLQNQNKVTPAGRIGRGQDGQAYEIISDAPFQYDISVYTSVASDVEKYLKMLFGIDTVNAMTSVGISVSRRVSDIIINAFRMARVPSEKALAFGRYLASTAQKVNDYYQYEMPVFDAGEYTYTIPYNPETGSVLMIFLFRMYVYEFQKDEQGNLVLDEDGRPIVIGQKFNTSPALFDSMVKGLDLGSIYQEILKETGMNPEEAGRVLYQIALALSGEDDQELIRELGEESFVVLFSRTAVAANEIPLLLAGSSLASARMAAELVYELGAQYRKIIDTFGAENLNKLFGGVILDNFLVDMEQPGYAGYVMKMIAETQNIFGYSVAFMSEFFTCLDNKIAYSYYDFALDGGDKSKALTALYIGEAAAKAFSYASAVTGISAAEAGDKLAKINTYLYLISNEEQENAPGYEEVYAAESAKTAATLHAIEHLAALAEGGEKEEIIDDEALLEEIRISTDTVLGYTPEIEEGLKMSATLIAFNYLVYYFMSMEE